MFAIYDRAADHGIVGGQLWWACGFSDSPLSCIFV